MIFNHFSATELGTSSLNWAFLVNSLCQNHFSQPDNAEFWNWTNVPSRRVGELLVHTGLRDEAIRCNWWRVNGLFFSALSYIPFLILRFQHSVISLTAIRLVDVNTDSQLDILILSSKSSSSLLSWQLVVMASTASTKLLSSIGRIYSYL